MGLSGCLSPTLDGAVVMAIEVQPGASRQGIVGFNTWRDRLSVAVKAEAQGGQANRAVLHVLAQQLKHDVVAFSIVAGQTSRQKSVRIAEIEVDELMRRLERCLQGAA
jgi:uncharacterized protein (TIGR00251 family)